MDKIKCAHGSNQQTHSPLFRWHILSQRNTAELFIFQGVWDCFHSTPVWQTRVIVQAAQMGHSFLNIPCSVCIYLPCCLITLRSLQESHLSLVQHANEQNILLLWFFTISVLHNTWHNIYNYHDCCGNNCNVYLHKGTSTYAITKIWDVFCTHKIESKHSCTQQKRKTNNGQLSA